MRTAECHQGSFYCYIPLGKQQSLILLWISVLFSPSSWSSKQCQLCFPSHGMVLPPLKSNQISAGYSCKLCADIMLVYLAGRTPLQIEGFVTRVVFIFIFWQHTEHLPTGVKALGKTNSTSLLSSVSCVAVVVSNRALSLVRREQPVALATSWVFFFFFLGSNGTPLANNSIRYTQSQYWKFCLVRRGGWLGSVPPSYYFTISFRLPSYVYVFKSLYYMRFSQYPSNGPLFQISLPVFPPLRPSPFSLPP